MTEFVVNDQKILKVTENELSVFQALLDKHDRGAFYLLYNSLTGSEQAYLQTQISSFSGSSGGAAFAANRILQELYSPQGLLYLGLPPDYPGIYQQSQRVAQTALEFIRDDVDDALSGGDGTGNINNAAFLDSAQEAWIDVDALSLFPGNILTPIELIETALGALIELVADILTNVSVVPVDVPSEERDRLQSALSEFVESFVSPGTGASILATLIADDFDKSASNLDAAGFTRIEGANGIEIFVDSDGKVRGVDQISSADALAIASNLALSALAAPIPGGAIALAFLRGFLRDLVLSPDPTSISDPTNLTESTGINSNGDRQPFSPPGSNDAPAFVNEATGGDDILQGSRPFLGFGGEDVISGNDGNDFILGAGGNDELRGDAGADILYGQAGNDILNGGEGNDELRGGAGDDTLIGGEGNDLLDGGDFTTAVNGDGIDTADYSEIESNLIFDTSSLSNEDIENLFLLATDDGFGGTDTLHSIEIIIAGSGDDEFIFTGDISSFSVRELDGGEGDADILDLSGVMGSIELIGANPTGAEILVSNFEEIVLSDEADAVDLRNAENDLTISGGQGADNIISGAGADTLYGGSANGSDDGAPDTLDGGEDEVQDIYYAGDGDIIRNADDKDVLIVNGEEISGKFRQFESGGDYFFGADEASPEEGVDPEEVARFKIDKDGNFEVLGNGGDTAALITIENFNGGGGKGAFGITLSEYDDENDDEGNNDRSPQGGQGGGGAGRLASPLVLDLDGDGFDLIELETTRAFFDIDRDGFAERTGWVGADDGLLALDRNGDGEISDQSELFGYSGVASFFGFPDEADESGFAVLAELDDNADNVIDASDAGFTDLKVWRDLNRNGFSEADELFSLQDLNIESISVNSVREIEELGTNLKTDTGTFTFAGGATGEIADIWFAFDSHITRFDDRGIDTSGVADLPELPGYGEYTDLRIAMAENPALEQLVRDVVAFDVADAAGFLNAFEEMVAVWFGVNGADPFSRESRAYGAPLLNADARKLEIVEKLTGRPFFQRETVTITDTQTVVEEGETDPRPQAGGVLTDIYRTFIGKAAAQFISQTPLGDALFPELSFTANAFTTIDDGTSISTVLSRLDANAPADFFEKVSYWGGVVRILEVVVTQFAETEADAINAIDDILAAQGLPFDYDQMTRGVLGGDGVDVLTGQNAVSFVEGRSNNGADVLVSGAGEDIMNGLSGNDTYVWGRGQSNDVIREDSFNAGDKVLLQGLTEAEVSFSLEVSVFTEQLVVTILDTGETLTIEDGGRRGEFLVFEFADGTVKNDQDILSDLQGGTPGDDLLRQKFLADPSAPLDGLGGDDALFGDRAATTYNFGLGYGVDTVIDAGRANDPADQIVFLPGVTANDIEYERRGFNGQDLVIKIIATDDEIIINGQYAGNTLKIESFYFEDGFGESAEIGADEATFSFLSNFDRDDLLGTANEDEFNIEFQGNDYTARGFNGSDIYNISSFQFETGTLEINDGGRSGDVDRLFFQEELRLDVQFSSDSAGAIVITSIATGASIVTNSIEEFVFNDLTLNEAQAREAVIADQIASGQTEITGTSSADTIALDDLDQIVRAGGGADTVSGGGGQDRIFGQSGNDRLEGGPGDDTLTGDSGDDLYIFNAGDGVDVIADEGGGANDALEIVGYELSDASFDVFRGDLGEFLDQIFFEISFAGSDDKILILDPSNFRHRLEEIRFDNGGEITIPFSGAFVGTPGDDILFGADADDTLDGGAGNDRLFGGRDDDDFVFGVGYGEDTIFEIDRANANVIVFNADTAPSDVILTRTGENLTDLKLQIFGTTDVLTVENAFGRDIVSPLISEVRFDDGTIWDQAYFDSVFAPITAGDDYFIGTNEDNVINASAGDDTLQGGNGGDTYRFGAGSGTDRIVDTGDGRVFGYEEDDGVIIGIEAFEELRAEMDVVEFGPGVTLADLIVTAVGDGLTDLSISINGTSDTLIIEDQLAPEITFVGLVESGGGGEGEGGGGGEEVAFATGIEKFVFDDGTELTREDMTNLISSRANEGDNVISTGDIGGILDGGAGDDTLNGGDGNDVFRFARGYGDETISDSGGEDVLEVGSDLTINDLYLTRMGEDGQDLLIEVGGDEKLTAYISGQFAGGGAPIDAIEFSGGESLTAADLRNLILFNESTEADDNILGFASNDVIRALRGADTITGLEGDDAIDGGLGRDTAVYLGASADYSIVNNADGTITVTDLAPDVDGDDGEDLLVNIEDLLFLGDSQDVAIAPLNGAPTANSDTAATDEDTTLTIDALSLLANDADPDNDPLTILSVSNVVGGVAFLNAGGEIVFTPDENFNGAASFDYTVADPDLAKSTTSVAVTVHAVNDAPVAFGDAFSTSEDEPITILASELFANDLEVDGDALTLQAVQDFVGGTAVIKIDGDVEFTPDANFNGDASFTYSATDGLGEQTTATVNILVAPILDAPVAAADMLSTDEDTSINVSAATLLANDTSVEGGAEIINFGDFNNVIASFAADGSIDITPFANFNGIASFEYTLVDDSGEISTAVVTVDVSAVDDAPLPQDDFRSTTQNQPLVVTFADLLANDVEVDGEALQIVAAADGPDGSVDVDFVNETVTFTPDAGFFGGTAFSYTVQDAGGIQSSALVFVDVEEAQNQAPTDIALSNMSVDENSPEGTVIGNISASDPDTDETFTFRVKPPNDSLFAVSGTQLIVAAGAMLDFETSPIETIEIEVEDSAGNLFSKSFDITINDVAEGIVGTPGNDALTGTPGDDVISALAGNDTVQALGGDDVIDPGLGSDTIDGGAGFDLLDLSATSSPVFAYLDANYASGADYGQNFLSNIEGVIGGAGDDQFVGDAQANRFVGNDGADSIYARDGADTLDGGTGDDYLHGEGGDDVIIAGDGVDVIYAGAGDDNVDGGSGNDTIFGQQGADTIAGGQGADLIYTEDGDDRVLFARGDGVDVVYNANGDDIVEFGASVAGSDLIFTRVNQELFIGIQGETDSIELKDFFNSSSSSSFTIVAGDGAAFTRSDVEAILNGGSAAPVVLDLDGDGVELVSAGTSRVRFDFDGDGARERGGWAGRDDGFLALDRNGNGRIDNIAEISFLDDTPGARSDLEGLGAFDTNGDGALTAADDAFGEFLVWRDRNQNGRSERGELKSLADLGIESISPVGAAPSEAAPALSDDNVILGGGAVLWTDGSRSDLADVALRYHEDSPAFPARGADMGEMFAQSFGARDYWRALESDGRELIPEAGAGEFRPILSELRELIESQRETMEMEPASITIRSPGLQKRVADIAFNSSDAPQASQSGASTALERILDSDTFEFGRFGGATREWFGDTQATGFGGRLRPAIVEALDGAEFAISAEEVPAFGPLAFGASEKLHGLVHELEDLSVMR